MGSVKDNQKPRIVFSYQDFRGIGTPENILLTFERDPQQSREKAFEYVVAQIRELYFTKKPEIHLHD